MYALEYGNRWQSFLENVQLRHFENLMDASDKLKVLTALESPFKDLFKGIWDGRRLRISETDVRYDTKDDRKWLDEALKSLDELQRALYKITSTSEQGKRITSMSDEKLKDLTLAFVKAKGDIEIAVKLADPNLVTPASRALNRALTSSLEAVVRESQTEVDALWKREVSDRFAKDFADRYPFVEAASTEVPLKTFSEVFGAAGGSFWKTHEIVRRLNAVIIGDRRLVAYSADFEDCIKKAEDFRKALYASGTAAAQVNMVVIFTQRSGVAEISLAIGEKRFSSHDDPDMRCTVIWSEAAPRGAKIGIRYGESQWVFVEKYVGQDWGLLRLLAEGDPKPKGAKSFVYGWPFKVLLSGKENTLVAECSVEADDKVNPFIPKFFSGFKCPEKVGP